jgi:hypothetical protein
VKDCCAGVWHILACECLSACGFHTAGCGSRVDRKVLVSWLPLHLSCRNGCTVRVMYGRCGWHVLLKQRSFSSAPGGAGPMALMLWLDLVI